MTSNFNIYETLYKPVFKLGDKVHFITDEEKQVYLVYAYLIDMNDRIRYSITRKGEAMFVSDFEIQLID